LPPEEGPGGQTLRKKKSSPDTAAASTLKQAAAAAVAATTADEAPSSSKFAAVVYSGVAVLNVAQDLSGSSSRSSRSRGGSSSIVGRSSDGLEEKEELVQVKSRSRVEVEAPPAKEDTWQ